MTGSRKRQIDTRTIVFFILFGIIGRAGAQSKQVTYTHQQWLQYYTVARLPGQWTLAVDAGFRWQNLFSDPVQYIVRAGIGHDVTERLNVGVGYTNSGFYSTDTLRRWEHRPYQEIFLKSALGNWSISQRLRAEERFFKVLSDDTRSFNLRFRYSWLCSIPLAGLSRLDTNCKLLVNLGDEIFINAGKKIVYNVFDQNRIIIGLGIQINKQLVINANFNHQFIALPAPGLFRQDYVIWINGRHLFDFRHKS